MDFSTGATNNSYEKVLSVALPFGLFLWLQWKGRFFYSYGGNRIEIRACIKEESNILDPAIKKQVLRTFTYGLYAVSCANEGEVNIFTANWLTQVSFDPPLLAVSVENVSKSLPMILRSRKFTINVYRSGERELAGKLGKSALKQPDKLANIGFNIGANGCPILHNALAWVACEMRHTVEAGDSTLIVAEVVDVGMLGEGQSLTMAEAGFRHAG
jgi:flavin reductase (DIM6/NTAB) family NADH-FMN oxidoreductase RutF